MRMHIAAVTMETGLFIFCACNIHINMSRFTHMQQSSYTMDNRQDNTDGKGSVAMPSCPQYGSEPSL